MNKAVCSFFDGSLIVEGREDAVEKVDYSFKRLEENLGSGEVNKAILQMMEYRDGKRRTFDFVLDLKVTDFRKQVFVELMKVEFGHTVSYGELSRRIGNPKGARAIGNAMNNNPCMIVVPCHRVIGTNGSLVGFAGGLELKQQLLDLER
ncbi:MAG: methylated-DNA--[protein]-cysteine S-methyltransferase [Erysipelotrichaceae bacterium]|nr:methylated-DNA--[protein]-cysteine S-methyltransferase [Erysipelotrichaceae bacterium]MDP3305153.1 methylated-DNA--[protein]-cysteine S-methyltransferase [Erysipelotrichaceae bacterium]